MYGYGCDEPRSGGRFFRRSAAHRDIGHQNHGLQPWLHSNGAPRLNSGYTLTALRAWELLNSNYGFGITDICADFDCLFHRDGAHGIHGSQDHAYTACAVRFLHDLSRHAHAKHDHVLFHRYRKAGERPRRAADGWTAVCPADEGVQGESVSTGAVG